MAIGRGIHAAQTSTENETYQNVKTLHMTRTQHQDDPVEVTLLVPDPMQPNNEKVVTIQIPNAAWFLEAAREYQLQVFSSTGGRISWQQLTQSRAA